MFDLRYLFRHVSRSFVPDPNDDGRVLPVTEGRWDDRARSNSTTLRLSAGRTPRFRIDGSLNDRRPGPRLPWSDDFVDITGDGGGPRPRASDTRVKMGWDDSFFYVGATDCTSLTCGARCARRTR